MAASTTLKFITLPAMKKHSATVIFLHGLGDKGSSEFGWKYIADMFRQDPALDYMKWILPDALDQPITVNGGMRMPAWFDMDTIPFTNTSTDDEAGIRQSMEQINQLISTEVDSGTLPSRIILGGFSQGGAMALLTGLTEERKLAGVISLSGWLPLRNKFTTLASPNASSIPVFMGHGSADPVIDPQLSQVSAEFLTSSLGFKKTTSASEYQGLTYTTYPRMAHTTVPKELDDVKQWMKQVLPAAARL